MGEQNSELSRDTHPWNLIIFNISYSDLILFWAEKILGTQMNDLPIQLKDPLISISNFLPEYLSLGPEKKLRGKYVNSVILRLFWKKERRISNGHISVLGKATWFLKYIFIFLHISISSRKN